MAEIVLLGFAAAVFPTLLACVAIMISRPRPRRLLLGFYLGGLFTSITAGLLILRQFNAGNAVLSSTASSPDPSVSIVMGAVGLVLAWLMISARGRALIEERRRRRAKPETARGPSWAERRLETADAIRAFAIGAVINLPGPWYLLALGDIAEGGYTRGAQLGLVLLFNAIMFILVEVPLVGYLAAPQTTEQRVAALSRWLNANGLRITGIVVALASLSLIARGAITALT